MAKANDKSKANEKLKQTKGKFKLIGIVSGIDKDGAYKEDVAKKGMHEGETFRSLNFRVRTSETNNINVSMFSYEPERIFLWNSEKKKNDKSYKGDWVEFVEWEENQDKFRDEGYAVLQTRVGLTYGEDGKIESKGLPSYLASKEIYENINNGDSVVVEGNISYSTYKDQNDKVVNKKNFNIEKIFRIKDVDFEDEKFVEVTYFEQQIVFVDAFVEAKDKKVFVTGRNINYNKTFIDVQFVIDYSDGDGGEDADMKKLATTFAKKMKFGDLLNVYGDTLNRVIIEESEEEDNEDENLLASLGGRSKPKYAQKYVNKRYVNELQIHGADAWDKKEYKEEDFKVEELIEKKEKQEKKNPLEDELGGKKKKSSNPFDTDVDDEDEFNEDELPF
jgi:hypothetical protein